MIVMPKYSTFKYSSTRYIFSRVPGYSKKPNYSYKIIFIISQTCLGRALIFLYASKKLLFVFEHDVHLYVSDHLGRNNNLILCYKRDHHN